MERPGVVFSIFLVALIGTIQTTMAFDDGLAEISFSVLVFVSSFIIGIYVLYYIFMYSAEIQCFFTLTGP